MVVAIVMLSLCGKPPISYGTIDYQISVKLVKLCHKKIRGEDRGEDYTVISYQYYTLYFYVQYRILREIVGKIVNSVTHCGDETEAQNQVEFS